MAGALAVLAAACSSLRYADDVGFFVSAQANSPEFIVYINGHLCNDMEGTPGLCSRRVKSTEDILVSFDAQQYPYALTVSCPSGITPIPPADVPSGQAFSFSIPASSFSGKRLFVCVGEVSPQDRTAPISSRFVVTFSVYDANYVSRERAYIVQSKGKNLLVLGQHARTAWVYDEGKWGEHKKEPIVQIKGDPSKVKAYSESFTARFNFYNLADADGPIP